MTSKERFPTNSFVFIMIFGLDLLVLPRLFPRFGFRIITENELNWGSSALKSTSWLKAQALYAMAEQMQRTVSVNLLCKLSYRPRPRLHDRFRVWFARKDLFMTEIKLKKGEPVERALRRLKKKLDREQTLQQVRLHRRFEKPSARKRRKEKAARFAAMLKARYADL